MDRWVKIVGAPVIALALAAPTLAEPSPTAASSVPKAERKPTPSIWVYHAYRFDFPGEPRADLIREIWSMNSLDAIPVSEYPADAIAAKRKAKATLKIAVAPDDSIAACTLLSTKDDVELAAQGCNLIRKYGKFKHAVDKQGNATLAEIILTVDWDLRDFDVMNAPAPPQSSRWHKRGRYEANSWPPLDTYQMAGMASVAGMPNWNDFKVKQKGLPKKASTGVQIALGEGNQAASCVVRESSGIPTLDKAACDAMMKATYTGSFYNARYPPVASVLVNWDRGKGSGQVPSRTQSYPELIVPGTISAKDISAEDAIAQRPVRLNVELDANGKPQSCIVNTTSGSDAIDTRSCAVVEERSRFKGALDLFGRPYPGGMLMIVDWKALTISTPHDFAYR